MYELRGMRGGFSIFVPMLGVVGKKSGWMGSFTFLSCMERMLSLDITASANDVYCYSA